MSLYLAGLLGVAIGQLIGGWCRHAKLADVHMQGWKAGWLSRAAFEKSTEAMIAEAELRNAGFTREVEP